MHLVAKGMIVPAYHGHGIKFPRSESVELHVSDEIGKAILADPNVVAIAIPEVIHQEAGKNKSGKA